MVTYSRNHFFFLIPILGGEGMLHFTFKPLYNCYLLTMITVLEEDAALLDSVFFPFFLFFVFICICCVFAFLHDLWKYAIFKKIFLQKTSHNFSQKI